MNEELRDRSILRGALVEQFKAGEVREAMRFVDRELLPSVRKRVRSRVARIRRRGRDPGPVTTRRLRRLEGELHSLVVTPMRELTQRVANRGTLFARREAAWQREVIEGEIPVIRLDMTMPTTAQLHSVVVSQPFDGKVLRRHFADLRRRTVDEVMREIRLGIFEGDSTESIVRRVTGTRAARDGVFGATRRHVEAIVRTAITHAQTDAREALYAANADLVREVQWVSTLDASTCFPAGTRIETEAGPKPIEDVREGERVLTHRGRYRRVRATMRRAYEGAVTSARIGGRWLSGTSTHRVLCADGEWRELQELQVGDEVLKARSLTLPCPERWERIGHVSETLGAYRPDSGGFWALGLASPEGTTWATLENLDFPAVLGCEPPGESVFEPATVTRLGSWITALDVYNLEVEEDHSYVAESVVVHNCLECAGLDGRTFARGSGPRPPAHIRCRCTTVPVIRSWREMGVKLTDPTFTRADNARIRAGLDGRVSQRVTYPQWLRRQNAAIQTEVLGPARRKLWQEGRIEVRSFTNRRGRILRLDELPVAERRLRSGQPRG